MRWSKSFRKYRTEERKKALGFLQSDKLTSWLIGFRDFSLTGEKRA
jgi:hypothetical protein